MTFQDCHSCVPISRLPSGREQESFSLNKANKVIRLTGRCVIFIPKVLKKNKVFKKRNNNRKGESL